MKIALIAVSGLRIYNERLRRHGISLPGFVERGEVIASMPSLGLLTLAACTPDRHRLSYHEVPEFDESALRGIEADVVAISSFTAKSDVMYAIAAHFRSRGVKVVLGGLHATLCPDEAAAHADAVVVGEGEAAWPRVLEDLEAGVSRGLCRSGRREVDLADTPIPRYDLLDLSQYNRLPVQTARGCPLACEFCAASRILGPFKLKPVERVTAEIREIKRLWPRPFIELADDNTFVKRDWAKDLVRALAREDVRWFTETDVSVADDPELLDLLGDSGCRQVLIGFESPRASSLTGLDARDWKRRRYPTYRRAIDAIQRRGVAVNGCFIVGLDEDTPDVFPQIADFATTSGLADVQVTVLTPFPNTALHRRLKAEGRLLRDRYWEQCTLFDVTFRPKRMSVADLEQGLEHLMGTLYSAEATRDRREEFLRQARRGLREAS